MSLLLIALHLTACFLLLKCWRKNTLYYVAVWTSIWKHNWTWYTSGHDATWIIRLVWNGQSSWQRQLMRGNVVSFTVFACLSSVDENKNTCTGTIGKHSTCKRISSEKRIEMAREDSRTKRNEKLAQLRTMIVVLIWQVHVLAKRKYVGVLHQQISNAIMSKTLQFKSFFFLFLSSSRMSGNVLNIQHWLWVLYASPVFASNKTNRKKFVSHEWFSCNHFALHQRKTSFDLLQ